MVKVENKDGYEITFFEPPLLIPIDYLYHKPNSLFKKEVGTTVKVVVYIKGNFSKLHNRFNDICETNLTIHDITGLEISGWDYVSKSNWLPNPDYFSHVVGLFNEEELPERFRFASLKEEHNTDLLYSIVINEVIKQELGL